MTYPQPSSKATPLLVVLEEQQPARLLCYTSSPIHPVQGTALPEWEHLTRRGMCTREDLLRLTLQEGCWYNLRSRKAMEDSKGAASLTRLSCDADETRKGWAAWSSVPGGAARARESSDSGIDSEELSPSLQFRHGVCAVAG